MAHLRYESALGATPQFDFGNPRSASWTEFDADLADCGYDEHAVQAIRDTRPLSVLMAEQVQALREWALPRTVPAD